MVRFFKIVVMSLASLFIGVTILGVLALVGFCMFNFFKGLMR